MAGSSACLCQGTHTHTHTHTRLLSFRCVVHFIIVLSVWYNNCHIINYYLPLLIVSVSSNSLQSVFLYLSLSLSLLRTPHTAHRTPHTHTQLLMTQTVCCPLPGLDPHPECCPFGPMWVWWYVNALPTSPECKIDFLKLTSLRERLLMLKNSLHLPMSVCTSTTQQVPPMYSDGRDML